MRRLAVILAAAGTMLAAPALATDPADTVKVVLKFVKRTDGAAFAARFDPASCRACSLDGTPYYSANNPRETVIALNVPRSRWLELAFDTPGDNVRRVIVEGGDVPFRVGQGRGVVQLAPLTSDAITAAEFATHIVEPGMVLRFEHADPERRSGDYASGPMPTVQRDAANVLEFAQREAVRELGLGAYVERGGLGRIQIMGFDTNTPHGHMDSPPHMHMHLRWPQNTGTQIGHFYIGSDGLLTHTVAGVKGLGAGQRTFGRGQAFTSVGPDGRGVYTHTITPDGALDLGRAGERPCRIGPLGHFGFASGATVQCPGQPARQITVRDDMRLGAIMVTTDDIAEVFRYDTDTGKLLSPAHVERPGPSVYVEANSN